MAQLNSLLVTGDSRFLNPINGNARNGVYYVKGTQTAATGAWTGNIPVPALYDGLTICYYLPYAGSGNATLNLTLSTGATTGAKNCYYQGNTRLTTHYGVASSITMTYHPAGSISVNGTATADDRWIAGQNYVDGNDISTHRPYYSRPTTDSNGIKFYGLYAFTNNNKVTSFTTGSGTGTKTMNTTSYFDISKIYYYNGSADVAGNTVLGANILTEAVNLFDCRYTFNGITTDSTSAISGNKPLYLCFDPAGSKGFYKLKSPYFTQNPNATGIIYVLIGYTYDYYRTDLWINNPAYIYDGSGLQTFKGTAASSTTGISIAAHGTTNIYGVQSSTTTASKVTLGTAISVPNVTSAGSASNWVFENITVPKAASSATSIPNVTAAGSGSFTATVTNGVLSFSHTHTAPTLGTAISVTGVSGSTTASHVKSGGNGTAPTLGTAISVPNVTAATDVTVPIKNASATAVVTGTTHTVTDNGHTHSLS